MTTTTREPQGTRAHLAAWNHDVQGRLADLSQLPQCREDAMDARRRREALERTQELVDELLAQRTRRDAGRTAVIVHRSGWVREHLAMLLAEAGVTVVGAADDGSHGLAHAVVAQPDLVVIEDHLPWTTSVELVHTARLYTPRSHLVVQVDDEELGNACLEAGADAVISRRVSLADLCGQCVDLLATA